MPASPRRWWWNACWPSRASIAARWAARGSSSGSGSGRRSPAARSHASCAGLARRSTGRASASPWTTGCPRRCDEVFVTLYRQGLIYRDRRLVNWDPKLQTAISDLEVENLEVKGHLWYIRYPIEGEAGPVHHGGDDPAGDDAGRYGGRGASGRRALSPIWSAGSRSCRWLGGVCRSSPTTTRIRRRAPAR